MSTHVPMLLKEAIWKLQWLRSQGCPWDDKQAYDYAAKRGHLEMLQWLRSQGCTWDEWTCANAARGGHLEVLKWV